MTKVFDDEAVARAFREASEALRRGDPDTLAGRFSPHPQEPQRTSATSEAPKTRVASRR